MEHEALQVAVIFPDIQAEQISRPRISSPRISSPRISSPRISSHKDSLRPGYSRRPVSTVISTNELASALLTHFANLSCAVINPVNCLHSSHSFTRCIVHYTVSCIVYCSLYSVLYSVCTARCIVHCTVYSALHDVLYTVYCALHDVLYTVYCALYSVLYTVYCRLLQCAVPRCLSQLTAGQLGLQSTLG